MNFSSFVHEAKSRYAYMYDKDTLHLRIKTGIGEVKKIVISGTDPFNWIKDETTGKHVFDKSRMKEVEMVYEGQTRFHDVWFAEITGLDTSRIRYGFIVTSQEDEVYLYGANTIEDLSERPEKIEELNNLFNFPYLNEEDVFTAPKWVRDAIWYQLTVNCYSKDGEETPDRVSGNFKGLTEKLDYIKALGCNAIYLTPIFEASSWHLYDTEDYFQVAKSLGGNEAFGAFMNKAHALGMKVMLDAVFNHCGYKHAFWQDVIRKGKESKYYDCFYILDETKPILNVPIPEDGEYEDKGGYDNNFRTFAYTTKMPKLNTSHPIMKEHLMEVATYWVETFGIDGWRLDVSNEVSHDFWRAFRKKVKAVNPDVYIMGENWDDSYPWLMGDQFDSVMNYGLMNNILAFVANPSKHVGHKMSAEDYVKYNCELTTKYPKGVTEALFNIVGSHDVDRIMDVCGFDKRKVKLSYVLELTYSGAPCIYYGDEVGMVNDDESESRTPMIWDEEKQCKDLEHFFKTMIALRKEHPSFKSLAINFLYAKNHVLIFEKTHEEDTTFILINNNEEAYVAELPEALKNREGYDLFNKKAITLGEQISLAPLDFLVIQ